MQKRKWKVLEFAILAITLLVSSYYIGWFLGLKEGFQTGGMTKSMAEFMLFNESLKSQMENADCDGLKKSLNEYLRLLEKYKKIEGSFLSDTVYYGDLIVTHARLARIERKTGNERAAQDHIKIALEACSKSGWEECSEEKILLFSKKLEEKNPILCLNNN